MSTYTGQAIDISRCREDVFDRISNLGEYQQHIDRLPEDVKAKIGDVKFTDDSIVITAAPVGEIVLKLVECQRPSRLAFEAQGAPVPLRVDISLEENSTGKTSLTPAINVEVPAMLRPFVAPKMQQAANQMGSMLGNLFSA